MKCCDRECLYEIRKIVKTANFCHLATPLINSRTRLVHTYRLLGLVSSTNIRLALLLTLLKSEVWSEISFLEGKLYFIPVFMTHAACILYQFSHIDEMKRNSSLDTFRKSFDSSSTSVNVIFSQTR